MAGLAGHYKVHSQSQTNLQQTLIENLNRQSELLEKILLELEEIHSLLRGLNVIETRIEKTVTSKAIMPSNHQAKISKEEPSLPLFLRDNPWVEILQGRILEENKK
jgi:hypothetical protein